MNGAIDESFLLSLTLIRIREMGRHSQIVESYNQSIPTSVTDFRRTFEDKIQNTQDSTESLQPGSVPRVPQLNLPWQMLRDAEQVKDRPKTRMSSMESFGVRWGTLRSRCDMSEVLEREPDRV